MSKKWLNASDVARELGVSSQTVRRLIAEGELPAYRFGRGADCRIDPDDLRAFIRNSRVVPEDVSLEACERSELAS